MTALIFVEGGGDHKDLQRRCAKAFRAFLEKCGFESRRFRVETCGGRKSAYDDFKMAHEQAEGAYYVTLLVDSEDPVKDIEKPWDHLKTRIEDKWPRPHSATDEQALLMTTCMETWIVADRATLQRHYKTPQPNYKKKGPCLQESALPSLVNLEGRHRHAVQEALEHATRNCTNAYAKGKRSFEVLEELDPDTLRNLEENAQPCLPSLRRALRILNEKL